MRGKIADGKAYKKIVEAFKGKRKGATVADIAAVTALPLYTVKELVPVAADEFSGRLEVTESGEILYSFPRGFASRFKGLAPFLKKTSEKLIHFLGLAGTGIFKVWIMVMLIGYFLVFLAIALASLFLSMAANSRNNNDSRSGHGGMYLGSSIFNLIIRLWFYSELTKSVNPRYGRYGGFENNSRPKGRPLHKAIFSFVFGDGDPNAQWPTEEKKTFIAYVQEHRGVVSLPELMAISGIPSDRAESEITALCAEFGGSPEATEDGTVVYRFDEILLRTEGKGRNNAGSSGIPSLPKNLRDFSSNKGKMNFWFSLINGVNLLFGSYFLYQSVHSGTIIARQIGENVHLLSQQTGEAAPLIYGMTYYFVSAVAANPLPIIAVGLGLIPLAFSILFWLIPALRKWKLKKENEKIKFENFRKFSFSRIWSFPKAVKPQDLNPGQREASPNNLKQAQDKALKEMGAYAIPEVTIAQDGEVYSFPDLEREKIALEKYRAGVNPEASDLGKIVFDSHE
ncbi:hypothetical protein [Leadbettera azotonutricia]|uniref:Iron-sulfur cluster biosynthesis family protein n=1 Tax=Leadbettera azotonutricia (strain ATCC BAA-888 / DSM 13862 / ZAS-9) TaxID=545695 RepID=F5YBJ6_LEAAZ|nr:hypothetical protein [Leadbettera azotonutricia]AEF81185.1 conserved hypothetical protein [Leadbettera azotonutricia ZAS-9]